MPKINKMRTISECAKQIKTLDPQTAITEYCIRQLVKDNKINHVMINSKALVDLDSLIQYFNRDYSEV